MKKSFSVHYDEKEDKDLINYINNCKGKSSRSAFVMNILYDLKNGKLNYNKSPINEGAYITQQQIEKIKNYKEEEEELIVDEETVSDFKKKFGK